MCSYFQGRFQLTVAQNLDQIVLVRESVLDKGIHCDFVLYTGVVHQILKFVQIDSSVFLSVDVLETKLGNTSLQRHLTTFKSDFLGISRSGFGSFVSTGSSASFTGTLSPSNTFSFFVN